MVEGLKSFYPAYQVCVSRINDPGVKQFLDDSEKWTDEGFFESTVNLQMFDKNTCSVICFCRIILSAEDSLKKISRCTQVLELALKTIDSSAFPARNLLSTFIFDYPENTPYSLLLKYNLLTQFHSGNNENSDRVKKILLEKLKTGLKKLFMLLAAKKLIKYLEIAIELQKIGILARQEAKIINILAVKYLQNSCGLFGIRKNVESNDKNVDDGVVVCMLVEKLCGIKELSGVLEQFRREVVDYMDKNYKLTKFPCRIKKRFEFLQVKFEDFAQSTVLKQAQFNNTLIQQTFFSRPDGKTFTFKVYHYHDNSIHEKLLRELKFYKYFTKANLYNDYSFEKLLGYNDSQGQLLFMVENYNQSLISVLTLLRSESRQIDEQNLKIIAKTLIKTFNFLKKNKDFTMVI